MFPTLTLSSSIGCRFSSRTMMEVVILDENDNTPVFSSSSYSGRKALAKFTTALLKYNIFNVCRVE